jgi:LPXTG-site transpeptidase (sortase) family protein
MVKKSSLEWFLIFVATAQCSVILCFLALQRQSNYLNQTLATQPVPTVKSAQTQLPSSAVAEAVEQPSAAFGLQLKIPKINVDAAVEEVGLTQTGDVGVPANPINAAWFKYGPQPGEIGNSVIDGHSGWQNKVPTVFNNLSRLRPGDKIYVEDKEGVVIAFVVRESRSYLPDADASDVFTSSDGKAHLNLITCAGAWDPAKKSYPDRLVVFADRE